MREGFPIYSGRQASPSPSSQRAKRWNSKAASSSFIESRERSALFSNRSGIRDDSIKRDDPIKNSMPSKEPIPGRCGSLITKWKAKYGHKM